MSSFLPSFLYQEAAAQALIRADKEKREAQMQVRNADGSRLFAQQKVVDASFKAFHCAETYRKLCK